MRSSGGSAAGRAGRSGAPAWRPGRTGHRRRAGLAAVALGAAVAAVALGACGSGSPVGAGATPGAATPGTATPGTATPGGAPGAAAPGTAQPVAPGRPLHWSACRGASGPKGLQCATLQVPLDYADPGRGTIGLALDRRPATGKAIGSLLTDPGGPGVSGVDFLPSLLQELPPAITDRFDVVGFDPRGVGRSDPVSCGTGRQLDAELSVDPAPPTAAGFAALVAADRRFAAGCEADSAAVLPYVSTVEAARDMDRIRAAVGDAKLNYLGFSYGTFLGATYAKLFPTRVRVMVLDGALDPTLGLVALVDAQSAALDRELDAFLSSCSAGSCGWLPNGNLASDYDALLRRVRAHPVAVPGSDRVAGPAAMLWGSVEALYDPASWPELGQALTALEGGDGTAMLALSDAYFERSSAGTYSNAIAAETAVDCLDAPSPTVAQLRADAGEAARVAPVFGVFDLDTELFCSVWPVPATGRPGPVAAPGSPPILVVGSTGDPVTPYAWAQALAHQLDHGVLLTRTGDGHTAYGFSSCIRTDVDDYLLSATPPPAGTVCPSD